MAATAGSNTKLTDGERQKLFAHMFKQIVAEEVRKRQASASIAATKKLAKSYDPTFTAQKIEHFLKIHFGEDDQKPVDRLKSDRENLEWAGLIPVTSGRDLLSQVDRVDGEQLIRGKGYQAGMLERDRVSGFDAGSADDRLWLESYDAGRSEAEVDLPDILARVQAANSKEEPPPAAGSDPFADAAE